MDELSKVFDPVFAVYVIWHPKYKDGPKIGDFLYTKLTRNIQDHILYRGPSIPVFFRHTPANGMKIPNSITQDAKNIAVVMLMDDQWVIDSDWVNYAENMYQLSKQNAYFRLYPIAVSKNAMNISTSISKLNFYRMFESLPDMDLAKRNLLRRLMHYFAIQLLETEGMEKFNSENSIKLFLSHAKKDGKKIAEDMKKAIQQNTSLETFFDATDIQTGEPFEDAILENINHCVLVVVQTDAYSTRPWCRRELLAAKKAKVPIVVANLLSEGEIRSFPYLGNLPTIRLREDHLEDIIDLVLSEVLRSIHMRLHFSSLLQALDIDGDNVEIITNSPEILDLHYYIQENQDMQKEEPIFLYPDPPLGHEEISILKEFQKNYKFITPTMLPIMKKEKSGLRLGYHDTKPLSNIIVGLSISNSPDLEMLGFGPNHLNDTLIEFTRYFLVNGARLAYGGDLRKGGYTETLYQLFLTYNPDNFLPDQKLISYLTWQEYNKLMVEKQSELTSVVQFVEVEPPKDMGVNEMENPNRDNLHSRLVRANSLSKMRAKMNDEVNVRIFLGGKSEGYSGKLPGIIEEADLAMKKNIPIYLIGAFGGATKAIIDALEGRENPIFTEEYHMKNDQYREMMTLSNEGGQYEKLSTFFRQASVSSLNNGLSEQENRRLFETVHVPEMIALVLKGLMNLKISNEVSV